MNPQAQIIQITPKYPPDISGVGDYVFKLKERFSTQSLNSRILTFHAKAEPHEGGDIKIFSFSGSNALSAHLESFGVDATVILHYVGYGYAKKGSPYPLLRILSNWKRQSCHHKLIVMFHEIYATGPIYSTAFWLSGLQKFIARKLLLLSDKTITNCNSYEKVLKQWAPQKSITCCEVFSNAGEPKNVPKKNPPYAVVFGMGRNRKNVYDHFLTWEEPLKVKGVKEIIDLGSNIGNIDNISDSFILTKKGFVDDKELSIVLSGATYGMLYYSNEHLGKSTIFASYLAYGIIPINVHPSAINKVNMTQQLQISSEQCQKDYQKRNIDQTVNVFLAALNEE